MGQRMGKDQLNGLDNIILLEGESYGQGLTSEALVQNGGTSPISSMVKSHMEAHIGGTFAQYKDYNILNPGWKNTGGRMGMRPLIRDYYARSVGLVYNVYTTDEHWKQFGLEFLKYKMMHLLSEKDLKDKLIVVAANQDSLLPDEANDEVNTVAEIVAMLDKELTEEDRRRIKVFPTVWATGEGVLECFDWMIGEINKKHTAETLAEPWREVAQEVVANSKDGMNVVKGTWKKLLTAFGHISQKTVTSAA
ncbi:uncharacterized protein LOC135498606 [Lineus longissimus]|uniref:uncharacterized protein LOC135498606 n=1 Tax=Lineus longissimus TaxID=88925 RepID=UPI002B4E447C